MTTAEKQKSAINTADFYYFWCPERESNPHALKDTWPSTMPVYQFQHLGFF